MATTTISGTTDVEDLCLVEYTESLATGPDGNCGSSIALSYTLFVCFDPSEGAATRARSLIRCKKEAIPSGVVTGFRLKVYKNGGLSAEASIYRVKDANTWVEGTGTGAAQTGSSCWNKRIYNTTNWAGSVGCGTSGTDYFADASPPTLSSSAGSETITLATSWATDWRDSVVADNGLLVKLTNEAAFPVGEGGFESTESPSNQPYWEVDVLSGSGAFISRPSVFSPRKITCR